MDNPAPAVYVTGEPTPTVSPGDLMHRRRFLRSATALLGSGATLTMTPAMRRLVLERLDRYLVKSP